MPRAYIPILIFALLAAAFPLLCFVRSRMFELDEPNERDAPGERGGATLPAVNAAATREHAAPSFIAALFAILSVECVFLFVWAVKFEDMGGYGLILLLIFTGIPLAGYAWLYEKGIFNSM
jgi:NADH-quinone oxidoreductase subunit A